MLNPKPTSHEMSCKFTRHLRSAFPKCYHLIGCSRCVAVKVYRCTVGATTTKSLLWNPMSGEIGRRHGLLALSASRNRLAGGKSVGHSEGRRWWKLAQTNADHNVELLKIFHGNVLHGYGFMERDRRCVKGFDVAIWHSFWSMISCCLLNRLRLSKFHEKKLNLTQTFE